MAKRSVASATISFGLVAIPVKFYLAASPENVSFNMITKDGNRVKQVLLDAVTDKEVDRSTVRKGYEYAKGQFVIFEQSELKALGDDDGGTMEIKEFVPLGSLDNLHIEKSFYLDTGKGGDKAYRLLVAAMKKQNKLAVAQWTNRGRQHLIVLAVHGDGLIAHQMFYHDEVRSFELDCAKYTPRDPEIDMACRLIDGLTSETYDPTKYTNSYNERVLAAVEAKRAGGTYASNDEGTEAQPTNDLMAMLMASLKSNAA
jgi:DNA end-binding protein Ku